MSLEDKVSLPNKLLQSDGTITDITGKTVTEAIDAYKNKPALPNKFLNPDGTYSTLNEIIGSMIDTDLFIIVNELPASGDEQKIYLLPDGDGGFIEYHWTGTTWDIIGSINNDFNIFIWDGQSSTDNPSNIQLWQDIYDKSISTNVIVMLNLPNKAISTNYSFCVVNADMFTPTQQGGIIVYPSISFNWCIHNNYNSTENGVSLQIDKYLVTVQVNDGIVTNVSNSTASSVILPAVLSTNNNVADNVTFTPTLNGHPVTKKYVDDQISARIDTISAALDVINGEVI